MFSLIDLFCFVGALVFPILPKLTNEKIEFFDIILLFYLYIDISSYFVSQYVNYIYLMNTIVLIYSLKYLFIDNPRYFGYFKSIKNAAFMFLGAFLILPVLQGANIDKSTRFFSVTYVSIILLPIALHYYATRGDIHKLLRSGYYFILIWCLFVLYATYFKLGDEVSERVGGTIFHFGKIAVRGGITYIAFALMLVPLIWKVLKKREKIIMLCCVALIFATFFSALKRAVFFIVALAVINYLFNSKMGIKTKLSVTFVVFILLVLVPSGFSGEQKTMFVERYEARGAENKFSYEAVEGDPRFDEPLLVWNHMVKQGADKLLIGIEGAPEISLGPVARREMTFRAIHNEYGMLLYKFGIIGLFLYVILFYSFYRRAAKLKKILFNSGINVIEYWIVFQNLIIIFLIEAIAGGHSHPTFRGLVLLYSGAIAGHLFKLVKNRPGQNA